MNLFERLPSDDKDQLWDYLSYYSDGSALPKERLDHFLRYWNTGKEPFYRAFGENFIIKKELLIEKPNSELEDDMYHALNATAVVRDFSRQYMDAVRRIANDLDDYDFRWRMESFVDSLGMLVENVYSGPGFTIPGAYTVDKRPLVVNPNCKAVKMLGKIVKALGLEYKVEVCEDCGCTEKVGEVCANCGKKMVATTGYELFRQAHSQALNQKKIKGNLCLSIHPLDYLTMSDNDCGWTSCMSWMEEYGDYRLGTIEMMNSPCVIVAYVEASEDMWVCNRKWNNKRWRQLYIVTDTVILGNRQYPYHSDEIQGAAIRWIRDLMNKTPGYGPFPEESCELSNRNWNRIGEKSVHFDFHSCYMYNDIYDYRLAIVAAQNVEDGEYYECNFSGPAVCTGCGDEIEYETVEAHRVQCRACDGSWKCDFCGDYHSEYDEHYYVDDYMLCSYCYENEVMTCDCCEDNHTENFMNRVNLIISTDDKKLAEEINFNYSVELCNYCMDHPSEYEPLFGKMLTVKNNWGYEVKAFDVLNISDEGLMCNSLNWSASKLLKALRDAESDEDRLRLIEEIAY